MQKNLTALSMGVLFGLGLGVSGMTQPQKVVGFLDLFGSWNPALMFVMMGAIGLHSIVFPMITKRKSPILADQFHLPTRKDLNGSLLVGSALFGLGWGLGGYCPGPGITSLASGNLESFVFVAAMIAGMYAFRLSKPLVDKIFD